ncbi:vacuolar protein sorting-associated protein 11 homolog isoform X2 [Schistocerca gregaria]|nr:vacuolar protein sorting-associated protein 11 homolog isoform X2 [Schistocerca gregaria]
MACTPNLSHLAVGLSSGMILLSNKKQGMISTRYPEASLTTSLFFSTQASNSFLFSTTPSTVEVYRVNADSLSNPSTLDVNHGCDVDCSAMNSAGELIVARSDAIYFYSTSGLIKTISYPSACVFLQCHKWYVVLIEHDTHQADQHVITIYDPTLDGIVFSGSLGSMSHVALAWGKLLVLTKDSQAIQFVEKDLEVKLEMLYRKNDYSTALKLCQQSHADASIIADLHRKYGDYLYARGNEEDAIEQFILTIGILEASYVIKLFLGVQQIQYLVLYLEKLHEANLANPNHTELLINCYTRLNMSKELNEFLERQNWECHTEAAIRLCSQTGYVKQALTLAKKKGDHRIVLSILMEDTGASMDALEYIETLEPTLALFYLKSHGKELTKTQAGYVLKCLMKVWPKAQEAYARQRKKEYSALIEASNINALSDINASSYSLDSMSKGLTEKESLSESSIVKAEDLISVLIDCPLYLIEFLEYIIGESKTSKHICNTLLELYLQSDREKDDQKRASQSEGEVSNPPSKFFESAVQLLRHPLAEFEDGHALVLSLLYQFRPGILFFYEKMKLHHEVIQFYMDNQEPANVIKYCKKYVQDTTLWMKALKYLSSDAVVSSDEGSDSTLWLQQLLDYIEQERILPPFQVMSILSRSEKTTLGMVRDYLVRILQHEQQQIEQSQKIVEQLGQDTEKSKREIESIQNGVQLFQQMKCNLCQESLELPAVYFLCMHSFHLRCLRDSETECPICAPEMHNFKNLQRALLEKAQDQRVEELHRLLENSKGDGFGIIAKCFGKGIFSNLDQLGKTENLEE